ncbi:MAG: hypothetical protein NTX50_25485, partial [Candidatus Sumerlaeota bacterium]|nr:hypothetical protein [Candidatus Sumerlaeota bacterium]
MKNERRSSVQFHETDLACAIHAIRSTLPLMALLFGVIAAGAPAWSQDAANALAPKVLFDASAAGAEKLIPLDGATADELSVKIESNG